MSSKSKKKISGKKNKNRSLQTRKVSGSSEVSTYTVSKQTLETLSLIHEKACKEKELIQDLLKNLPDPIESEVDDSFELLGILTKSVPCKNIQLTFKGEGYTEKYRGLYMRTFIPKIEIFKSLLELAQESAHNDSVLVRPYPTILQYGITFWIFESEQFCQKLWDKYKGKVDADVWKMREDGSHEKISIYQDFVEGAENLRKYGFDYSAYTVADDYED